MMVHMTHHYTWLTVGGQTSIPACILFSKRRPLSRHLNVEATSNFSKNSKHSYFFVHLYLTGASNKVHGPKPVHNHTLQALPWKRTNLYLKKELPPGWEGEGEEIWRAESVQFSSVAQSSLTLCDPMDSSMPGLPVHHKLLEFTQTHVHWVDDAIQPSHPLLSPSPPAFNLSQHQGLFKWVSSSHQVTKVLEFQLQHQSFQWILRTDLL